MSIRARWRLWAGALGIVAVGVAGFLFPYARVHRSSVATELRSEWQRKYWDAVNRAESAEAARDWAKAARLYAQAVTLLPDGPDHYYSLARALANLERGDEALDALRVAVECGWADADRLREESVFAGIREAPGFAKLVQRTREVAEEQLVVYVPPGVAALAVDDDTRRSGGFSRDEAGQVSGQHARGAALVLVFHGRGQNPHAHIRSWKEAADQLGVVVAVSRGVDRFPGPGTDHSFRWDRSDHASTLPACQERVQQAIELASQRVRLDEQRIVVAGYSQGGSVALALLAATPERFCGAVAQATSYSPRGVHAWERAAGGRGSRVSLILHELDRLRSQGEAAYRELKEAGLDVRLDVVAGTDHELPADSTDRRVEALRFVLGMPALEAAKSTTKPGPKS